MGVETTIVREAPFLEEARKKLLGSADVLTQKAVTLPQQQLAGFSDATKQAFGTAQSGLGAYQPYLDQAGSAFTKAGSLLGGAYNAMPIASRGLGKQYDQLQAAGQTFGPQSQYLGAAGQTFDPQSQFLGAAGQTFDPQGQYLGAAGQTFDPQTQQLQAAGQAFAPQSQQLQAAGQVFAPQAAQLGAAEQALGGMGAQRQLAGQQLAAGEGILGALGQRGSGGLDEARQAAFLGAGDITGRIGAFQDPYQQQVIDSFQTEAARSAELARNRANQQAVQSGAFGGSRSGVESAELERNIADVTQRNVAGLLSQGYGQSLGAAEREAGRRQQLPGQLTGIEQLQYQLPSGIAAQMQQAAAQRGALGQQSGAEAAQRQALAQGYGAVGAQRQALAQGYGQQAAQRQALAQGYGAQGQQMGQLAAGYGQRGQQMGQLAAGYGAQGQQMGQLAAGYGAQGQQRGALAAGYGQQAAGALGLAGQTQSLAGAQQNLGGAYSGLAGLAQQLPAQDVALLSQVGSQQQQQAQRDLDLARQNILQQTYEPYQRVGYMSDILKGQPSVQSTLTQSTDPRGNPLSQALGAGISLAGIFGSGGFGTGYLFGGAGRALAGQT
jgi:hypothetical protein